MIDSALNLRRIYAEICRGYSIESWRGENVYIKHLNNFDQVDIDIFYEKAYSDAKNRGLKTREERLKWLSDKGIWTRKDISALDMQRAFVENMKKTRSKMFLKSQIELLDKQIAEANQKLWTDIQKQEEMIGPTCEKSADQKIQFYYIYLSCFKDSGLTKYLFSKEEIDDLDDKESNELLSFYIKIVERFNQQALRKISVSNYFTNYFYICGDNIYSFFNKPISELSVYQINLLSYAIYFKSILTQNSVPEDIREDPDKLEDYVKKSKNFKDAVDRAGDGERVGIVGGTEDDFKALNIKNDTDTMREIAAKNYTDSRDAARDLGYKTV